MDQRTRLAKIKNLFEEYENGYPSVSDSAYDEVVTEYLSKGGSYSDIYGDSLVRSEYPCLSQDNIYSEDELCADYFAKRLDLSTLGYGWAVKYSSSKKTDVLICTPKFDGVSVYFLIDPETKKPFSVFSRHDKRLFPFIEQRVIQLFEEKYLSLVSDDWFESYNSVLTVRVEVIMPKSVFEQKYKRTESNPDGKANPRNAVSGLLNKKYPVPALDDLDFVPFDKTSPGKYSEYFPEREYPIIKVDRDLVSQHIKEDGSLVEKGSLSALFEDSFEKVFEKYYCDGIVFRPDDLDYRESMGRNDHHWSTEMAYKNFNEEKHETVLKGVTFTLSPSGEFFPVGQLEPIQFKDAEVSNVTLNSMRFIQEEFEFPVMIGSLVTVIKSGDIIPKVIDVDVPPKDGVPIRLDECPYCETSTVRDGAYLFCKNLSCPEREAKLLVKQIQFLQEFLGSKGISEKTVRKLYNIGIRTFDDCIATNFLEGSAIEDAVGPSMTGKLEDLFSNLKSRDITVGTMFRLLQIEDFGRSAEAKFNSWTARNRNDLLFDQNSLRVYNLDSVVDEFFDAHTSINSKLRGRVKDFLESGSTVFEDLKVVPFELDESSESLPKYLVTGSLDGMSKKEFASSISGKALEISAMAKIDYLVCNSFNPEKPSGKAKKVMELQKKGSPVQIVNQEEFLGLLAAS